MQSHEAAQKCKAGSVMDSGESQFWSYSTVEQLQNCDSSTSGGCHCAISAIIVVFQGSIEEETQIMLLM